MRAELFARCPSSAHFALVLPAPERSLDQRAAFGDQGAAALLSGAAGSLNNSPNLQQSEPATFRILLLRICRTSEGVPTMPPNASRLPGRHFLQIPGPTPVPDRVLRAIDMPLID
jgi:hypothetical protein